MNCTEAQVLLAAHRDLRNDPYSDTTELDTHLEQCADCRQLLARYSLIGERVRALPALEPSAEMRERVMRALASEHAQFLQKSSETAPPAPAFLQPYLREHAITRKADPLAAFSSADTGPLPIIRPTRRKPQRPHMGQFAVLGLAAAFLIVLMMGGITSLLILTQGHSQPGNNPLSITAPTNIISLSYPTITPFQHVVSAVSNSNDIFYTAYGDGANNNWVLEELDRKTSISIPLLTTSSSSPLIVLSSDSNWLVWLQFDQPDTLVHGKFIPSINNVQTRTWSLHVLSLASQQTMATTSDTPVTILSGIFDQYALPDWVHTPVQGVWLQGNTLLVATTDGNGTSRLLNETLTTTGTVTAATIATADADHILTSPTATSDGSQVFWADEWRGSDNILHSNVWTQQTYTAPVTHGRWSEHMQTVQEVFLNDGMSYHPLVASNTLFLLSTASSTDPSTASPTATTGSTPSPMATPNTLVPTASWADASAYSVQLDDAVIGSLMSYPLSGDPTAQPLMLAADATALQAGNTFVLWQTRDGYGMWNAVNKSNVTTNDVLSNAQFLSVNGNTATWTESNALSTDANGNPTVTLKAFNWPRPAA